VWLCALPRRRIRGIRTAPGKDGTTGLLDWAVQADGGDLRVVLEDGGAQVAAGRRPAGRLTVPDCRFWAIGRPHLPSHRDGAVVCCDLRKKGDKSGKRTQNRERQPTRKGILT
jgi:hypothetical protein